MVTNIFADPSVYYQSCDSEKRCDHYILKVKPHTNLRVNYHADDVNVTK